MKSEINEYIRAQKSTHLAICKLLKKEITEVLPKANAKMYHRSPVWFIGENAVVGFSVTAKGGVQLLFWNGQALGESELSPVGKFVAAQIKFQSVDEIDPEKPAPVAEKSRKRDLGLRRSSKWSYSWKENPIAPRFESRSGARCIFKSMQSRTSSTTI